MRGSARSAGSSSLCFPRNASKEQRSRTCPSSTRGTSEGMAPSRSATAMTWLAGTKRNVGFLSMNRVISHGQAMRSTRAFSRVTHFISDLPLLLRLDAVGLVERSLQALSEFRRVVVGPEVHVEEPRLVHEPMVMDRGHVDAVLP